MGQVGDKPSIDVVLGGYGLDTNVGLAGFCMVTLLEGVDSSGQRKRILVDPAHVGRRPMLWEALAQRGLGPTDIDAVVLTHAHWDHIQNIDVFDHAPLLVHPLERAYSLMPHRNDWATPAWTGAILERQTIEEVVDGQEILKGVTVVDMPGHTPGSIGLAVENDAGLSVILGDALPTAKSIATGDAGLVFWDLDQARDSISRVVQMGDVFYPGHDRVFRLGNSKTDVEYLEPFQMTISNVASSLAELEFEPPKPDYLGPWVMPNIEEQKVALDAFMQKAAEKRSQA